MASQDLKVLRALEETQEKMEHQVPKVHQALLDMTENEGRQGSQDQEDFRFNFLIPKRLTKT